VQQYAKRVLRVPNFAAVAFNEGRESKLILIFDTNQSFHVRLAFRFFGHEIRNSRIYNVLVLFNSGGVPTRN
jgi:hypothetical protein